MKIPNDHFLLGASLLSLARIVSEDSQPLTDRVWLGVKSSKDS